MKAKELETKVLEVVEEGWKSDGGKLSLSTRFDNLPGVVDEQKLVTLAVKIEQAFALAENTIDLMTEGIRTIRDLAGYIGSLRS